MLGAVFLWLWNSCHLGRGAQALGACGSPQPKAGGWVPGHLLALCS